MNIVQPEEMARAYWQRLRRGAIKEVELKLTQFKHASSKTIRYWLTVHGILEKKAALTERKALS